MFERSHIIKKLIIDLQVSGMNEPERELISLKIKLGILDGLEHAGNQLDLMNGDKTYRFDKIIMNIPLEISESKDISKIVGSQFLGVLNDLKSRADTLKVKNEQGSKGGHYLKHVDDFQKQAKHVGNTNENDFILAQGKRMEDLFLFFIQNGQFPWWARREETLKSIEAWLQEINIEEWQYILKQTVKIDKTIFVNRMTAQFSENLLYDLQGKSGASSFEITFTSELIKELLLFLEKESFKLSFGEIKTIKIKLLRGVWQSTISSLIDVKDFNFAKSFSNLSNIVFQEVSKYSININVSIKWREYLEKSQKKDWLKLEKAKLYYKVIEPKTISEVDKEYPIIEYDVPQAGLVLLQPFISGLLQNLGLILDGDFQNDDLRERAVCVLHYLATGEEDFSEYKLGLPMLLCAWPSNEPISRFLILSDFEKEECNNVLISALNHWGVLKSTSPAGLIESFICREGKLLKEEFGWTLYVEKKAWDILLDKLPWGFHILKFKWMKEILTVNWN